MKLHTLLLLASILLTSILHAQSDFRPGYIIKHNGDTVFGKIDYRGDIFMGRTCKFKNTEGEVIKYSPFDISAYRFIDDKYYIAKQLDDRKVFLEFLIKGEVNFYYLRDDMGEHYYIDKEGERISELPFRKEIKNINGQDVLYKTTKHIGILKHYMDDAPGFQSKINILDEPDHKALILLGEEYHNTVCKDGKCIIYEKPKAFLKIMPEVVIGVMEQVNTLHPISLQTGINAHIWLPRINEKLYISLGVLYSEHQPIQYASKPVSELGKKKLYKIPIHVEYIYPSGAFRPKISYGVNIYNPPYHSVSGNIGANIRLSDSFFVSLTGEAEFIPNAIIFPQTFDGYSMHAGLLFNF